VGSMARALLPRTRRRGRSLVVGKVAAATSDLDVFFIVASEILMCSSNDLEATVRMTGSCTMRNETIQGKGCQAVGPSGRERVNYRYVRCGRDALSKLTCSYTKRLACCCSSESGRALPALSDCIKVISDNASSACRRLILR
jgi:hypothetical protein